MKFKVEVEIEILDEELLNIINNNREWEDKPLYTLAEEIPDSEIMKWCKDDEGYFQEEIIDYGCEIEKITILKTKIKNG